LSLKITHMVKPTKTPHFYTWHFKDWMLSGARTRLSWAARGIYHDLLGFCYTERLINNKAALMLRLGVTAEHEADMNAALAEFEVDKHGFLTHPRVKAENRRMGTRQKIASAAGKASAARREPRPTKGNDSYDPF
jgi:uncharacterized protein YdaU (DUF1376 family)